MSRYKEVAALAPVDAAYIAGLIDGEGTITLSRRHATDRRQLVVSIANTELPLLEFVLQSVGAGKITHKRIAAAHHTPSYTFAISNRQALVLLQQVYLFLRSHKRQRAELVLAKYSKVVPRNGKYTAQLNQLRSDFENDFFAITPRNAEHRGADITA